ncbi:unnamed protein product [Caenorhabditis nigoni]
MARKNECEKAIRFISNSIKNYTEPESLERWCDLAKTEAGYDKCADSFSSVISYRLDRIEDLKGYSLMEKVRLVFLFSRPVSSAFVEELKEAKCTVELNDKRKITYFCSPGGDCVLQADQDLNSSKRKFKGKQIQPKPRPIRFIRDDDCEKAIKFIWNGIKNYTKPENLVRWCDLAKTEVGYDKSAEAFDAPEALNNPEEPEINVLLLANNIGIIALYCSLEGVQKKASQAIEMIKREEREMTLNVADFNRFIDSMLKSIKRCRIRYSSQTEKFLSLKTVYRHIKLSLILPFGPEVTGEALKLVDEEIEEFGESQDEVPLETIRGNLEYLLNSSSGFWI